MKNTKHRSKMKSGVSSKKIFEFLNNPLTIAHYRKGKNDFTRTRSLTLPKVVISIFHLFKESVEFNLIGGPLQRILSTPVTGGAFSLARDKIKSEFFSDLCTKLLDGYLKMTCKKRWKEYLVIVLDGSMGILPSSKGIEDYFGVYSVNKFGRKRYMCRLFMAYDVRNDYVLANGLAKSVRGEVSIMMDCIRGISGKLRKYV